MLGVTFSGNRTIEFIDVPDPTPNAGEVVIEIGASGICGSDLHMYRGAKGMTIMGSAADVRVIRGHEPSGVVVARAAGLTDSHARLGSRVMVHHYSGCGYCDHCGSGWSQMCSKQRPVIYGINAHGS